MPIRTAILGYGRSGSTLHAGPIEKRPEFELAAVCDIDPEARAKAFDRFGCRLYTDYHDMLAKEDLDLVVIVTRSSQHSQMACDCLEAGKNVLVTKPWALNLAEADQMVAAAARSGKKLLPWLPARWGSDLLRLRELVASGAIGKVFQVRRSEFTLGVRFDWQTEKKYGGGYLLNWGPHLVDQPMQLVGTPVASVYGEFKQIINPGDVEDVFFAVLRTEDDVTIVTEFNIGAKGLPNWVVQGDRGTIFVREDEIEIHKAHFPESFDVSSYRNKVDVEVIRERLEGDRYGDAMTVYEHIARALTGQEPYRIPLDSARGLTSAMDAIRRSAETGQVVRLI
ncbi:MAG: Gfo/Idh/MocA family oxidoreductase [Eubacteriales bacterium]|nr:Gfo/Idh/MocA family oxidoreductase [Eubacteriales bacterium]